MAKIAILSFYSGVVERGVETFAYEMARRLQGKHQVTLFRAGQGQESKFKVKEIRSRTSPPQSQKGILGKLYLDIQSIKILIFSLKALPTIIKGKYQVIIPLNGSWQIVIYRIVSKLTKAKLLVSGHAGIGSDDAWNLLFRPDVFVALTSAQASWARKLVPEVYTAVIPNGVDLARFNPKVEPKVLSLEKPIVICAAALVPYKQVDLTVKAVAAVGTLSLLILGSGEMSGYIDGLGKRLLGKRYLRINPPYREMPGYYRAGKIFSIASRTEAFGIAYVEAMACNLAVVTTNDNSRAEIIGDAGILTDIYDIKKYAKDLTIAAKTKYHNLPYSQALKFSWNKVADKYSNLINEILS